MSELLDAAVSPANIIVTSLFIFIIIYWLVVIFGAIDMDFLDIDIDIDVDSDVDVDADMDADADGMNVSWFNSVLTFFNLGQIPLMVFFSFLIIPLWTIVMIVNSTFGITSFEIGLLVLLPTFFVSMFIAKFATTPFIKVFGKLSGQGERTKKLIGKVCEVTMSTASNKVGQAQINTSGVPYVINVQTPAEINMDKGQSALIIDYSEANNIYLIEPYNN